jgi:small GTP-binding protein
MDPQVSVHADQMISMGEYRFPHNPKCRSDPDMESRVVLIGEPGVGKTSLVQRLLRGEATENYQATVGAVFHKRDVQVDGRTVSLHIWDTAGQEKYRALGPIYYRKSLAAIAVCDQTKPETLQNLKPWIDAFRETADGHFVVIAANKEDLESDNKLDMEQIVDWAKEHQAECVSTSAQTGSGVEDLFEMVARHVVGKTSADVTLLREATTEKTSWC